MSIEWILIAVLGGAAVLCTYSRAAKPALILGVLAVFVFVVTPAGAGFIYFVKDALDLVDPATTGATTGGAR